MLILPIKKKWYDMILSGEKKEEYREIKPYWTRRLMTVLGYKGDYTMMYSLEFIREEPLDVLLKNGYAYDAPSFIAGCTLSIKTGKEEWGAEKGKRYYVFTIHSISAPV